MVFLSAEFSLNLSNENQGALSVERLACHSNNSFQMKFLLKLHKDVDLFSIENVFYIKSCIVFPFLQKRE